MPIELFHSALLATFVVVWAFIGPVTVRRP